MSFQDVKNYYLGLDGEKFNCSQSILKGFKDKFDIDESKINEFKKFGGGNAPKGLCGAYYATLEITCKNHSDKINELEEYFMDNIGHLKCTEIKDSHCASCWDCVKKCAEFLQSIDK